MKNKLIAVILLFTLAGSSGLWAQGNPRQVPPLRGEYSGVEEIVSLSKSTPFSQAVQFFNELSKKFLGKVIVDTETRNFPIGVNIQRTHWLTALEMILRENQLWYQEGADFISIIATETEEKGEVMSKEERYATDMYATREVQISAVFFEADIAKLRSAGMNWNVFRGKGVGLDISSNPVSDLGTFSAGVTPTLDWGNVSALFSALENDNVGEVISSPQVTVRSGEAGRIQVGSDIAVQVSDFARNTVTQFFSTGSIINVKPEIIQYDSVDIINLELDVERSSSSGSGGGSTGGGDDQGSGGGGLEIDRSSAKTTVLLLDGEETIIGGLYINQVDKDRTGIPFLKDLPWWFLGLRYVFGSETVSVTKKELLILVKAELLPSLEERVAAKMRGRVKRANLPEERRKQNLKMKYYLDLLKQGQ